MKKMIVFISIIAVTGMVSCGSNPRNNTNNPAQDSLNTTGSSATQKSDNNVDNPRASVKDSAYVQGAVLIANNDCKTCHAINKKMTGPSYNMVADKYTNGEGMRDELAYKIVHGGSGRWGNVVMPAHPQVTITDANQMANFILSLKTK